MPATRHLPQDTPFIVAAWRRFRDGGDRSALELLCRHYSPLPKFHARRVMPRGSRRIELADLISAGNVGLIEAARAFDPDGGDADFVAFSWKIIRRAMWDELEKYAWRSKSAARTEKLLAPIRERFIQAHGREPLPEELRELALADPRWSMKQHGRTLALPSIRLTGDAAALASRRIASPPDAAMRQEQHELFDARLSRRERAIFRRFFFQAQGVNEIARALRVHRRTVWSLLSPMVERLRADEALKRALDVEYSPSLATFSTRQNRGQVRRAERIA